jgi:hypothetical protein
MARWGRDVSHDSAEDGPVPLPGMVQAWGTDGDG